MFNSSTAADPSHVVPLKSGGARSPLFCFPGAGGDISIFSEMAAALPEGQPVYAIDMKSLCDAEQEFTIEQLAPFYLDVIRRIQRRGPYYFCGYSFGGLVAYEIAVRLIEEGDSAKLVALLDAPNPALLSNLSQTDAAQFHKAYVNDRLKKYAVQLMRGDIKAFTARGSAFLVGRLGRFFMPVIKKSLQIVKKPLPRALRSNDPGFLKAWQSYIPKPYEKNLVFFRVQDRGPEYDHDLSMGWDACVAGGVEVHVAPGSHVDMMCMPSVGVIADKLVPHLDTDSDHEISTDTF